MTLALRCWGFRVVFSLVFASCAISNVSAAEPTAEGLGFDPHVLAEIEGVVARGIASGEMPGAVVCVGRGEGIAFLRAFGNRQVEPTVEAMTTDTVFDLASLTKPVATATSLMTLVEAGKIDVEKPVAEYLPEFGRNGKETIPVSQLLVHTSGLIPDNALRDYQQGVEKAWELLFALKPTDPPGTKFKYSDVNFLVLGKLVEKLGGKPLDVYAREVVFAPLGMEETGFLPGENLLARIAPTEKQGNAFIKGRVHDPRAALLNGVAGHAGLFSSAEDLSKFCRAVLLKMTGRKGLGTLGALPLSKETLELMGRGRELPGGAKRALGWDSKSGFSSNRGANFSDRAFGHGGFTGTAMWIDPELDLFVIFLSSRLHPDGKGSVNRLAGEIGTIAARALGKGAPEEAKAETTKNDVVSPVLTGIDVLEKTGFQRLAGQRVGLITNHTGKNRAGVSIVKLLNDAPNVKLTALFSPEHGFEGELDEAGIQHGKDSTTGLTIYSLYGETRTPTAEMLATVDTLVFDIQDIGARFYTYSATMGNAMRAAAEHGKRFVVLDRPNPIGGEIVEGPVLDSGREAFVGFHTIAVRHGMTMGEMATMFQQEHQLKVELEVIKMEGWRRGDYWDATALTWINPSPNMRNLNQATLYPGIGLLETTNLSVGRGTDTPFEIFGAPWLNATEVASDLNGQGLAGVRFVPMRFTPESSKFAGEICQGINVIVVDRERFRPVTVGLAIAVTLRRLHPQDWETKGYDRLLIDKAVHDAVSNGEGLTGVTDVYQEELRGFEARRAKFLLY